VVSDTSAITSLLLIGRIDILQSLYGEILVPPAVEQELLRFHAVLPVTIQVRSVRSDAMLQKRLGEVDEGEAQAITLAEQLGADLLIIDEKQGRAIAHQAGLRYMGLVGLLIEAKHKGIVVELKSIFDQLLRIAGFRLSPALYEMILSDEGEI
jgi:uncharacterized protein